MTLVTQYYTCPSCGWDKLDKSPYKDFPAHPIDTSKFDPPYEKHWGQASYDVCSCCGFEFGNNDDPGVGCTPDSFQSALQFWIYEENSLWFEPECQPEDWSLKEQLKKAAISYPEAPWKIYIHKIEVTADQLDSNGVFHHPHYLELLSTVRNDILTKLDYDFSNLKKKNLIITAQSFKGQVIGSLSLGTYYLKSIFPIVNDQEIQAKQTIFPMQKCEGKGLFEGSVILTATSTSTGETGFFPKELTAKLMEK